MSWETLASATPDKDWLTVGFVRSRLIRLTYVGDPAWFEKFNIRAYLRLRVGNDGATERWDTIWPKGDDSELLLLLPIPIDFNYLQIRKRRDPYSLNVPYSVIVDEFLADPYLIQYPSDPFTVDEDPYLVNGEVYSL